MRACLGDAKASLLALDERLAFTAAHLAALETAAASGQLAVQIGDRRIQYQSLDQLMNAIKVARQDVLASGSAGRATRRYPEHGRGS